LTALAAGAPRVGSPRAKQQHQEDRPMANKTTASRKSDAVSSLLTRQVGSRRRPRSWPRVAAGDSI